MNYSAFVLIIFSIYIVLPLECKAQQRVKGLYNVPSAPANACCNIVSGEIHFSRGRIDLSKRTQVKLKRLALEMMMSPSCKVVVLGYGSKNERQQQLSRERTTATIKYLTEKLEVDSSRFIFQYGFPSKSNSVIYRLALAGEESIYCVPPIPRLNRD